MKEAALLLVKLGAVDLIDSDEAADAQAAHEMLLRGDRLAPSLGGEAFFEKPCSSVPPRCGRDALP